MQGFENPYKGIVFIPCANHFAATFGSDKGFQKAIGAYPTLEEAIEARRNAIAELANQQTEEAA